MVFHIIFFSADSWNLLFKNFVKFYSRYLRGKDLDHNIKNWSGSIVLSADMGKSMKNN